MASLARDPSKPKGRKKKDDKQPRTGAKANKEALEEIKKRLDECVTKDDFEKQTSDLQRATASVQVFKAQMKIFEKKFLADKAYDSQLINTSNIIQNSSTVFQKKESLASDKSKMSVSLAAAAAMKKTLQNNINRVDLLTDTKIGDIKNLMKELAEQVVKLSKRVTLAETEVFKKEYENIPVDVMALTKSEF